MKRIAQLVILAALILIGSLKLKAEDFEIWTFMGVETEWKSVEFSLTNANFFVPEGGWFLNFTQVTFDFVSNKSINFGIAYKQEYVKILESIRTEYRPMLHLYYTKAWGDFEFRDRNRMEFRFFESGMVMRYRNQLQLEYNKFERFSPYVNTEFFFYFNKIKYVRQRTALGMNIPIKSLDFNLFGVHQVDQILPDYWYNKFIFGTSLSYSF